MARKCLACAKPCIGDYCFQHKPKKPLKTTVQLKPRKPMNKIGKVGKATNAAMASWKRKQKPNHEGYYECYYCGKWVVYLRPEHTKSRAKHPEFRTDQSKFKPTCDPCNERKKSMDDDQFIELLKKEGQHESIF